MGKDEGGIHHVILIDNDLKNVSTLPYQANNITLLNMDYR